MLFLCRFINNHIGLYSNDLDEPEFEKDIKERKFLWADRVIYFSKTNSYHKINNFTFINLEHVIEIEQIRDYPTIADNYVCIDVCTHIEQDIIGADCYLNLTDYIELLKSGGLVLDKEF